MKRSIDSQEFEQKADSQYEEYLESIVDTIREALLILDKDLRVISANKTFYERFKVNPKQTEKTLVYELGNGQWDIPELRKLIEEILPSHNPFNNFRVEHKFPHIGKKVMLLNARQIKAKGKWKDRVLLAIDDITDFDKNRQERDAGIERERKAELALKDSLDRQSIMLEATNLGLWYCDLPFDELIWDEKVKEHFWLPKNARVTIDDFYSIIHPDDRERTKKAIEESINNHSSYDIEYRTVNKKNKKIKWIRAIGRTFYEKDKPIRFDGVTLDISENKFIEKQKDEFLGIASHELKTPVTSIKAYGQVLQTMFQRKGDEYAVEALQKMDAQVNKLTSLIGDLLDVTKIQSGRLEFHEEYFKFDELVKEIVEEMQLTTERHILNVNLGKAKDVYGDRERIGQVITNLINNAIKYSPHTKIINISTELDKNKVTLCVQDFGVGIPKEKQDKIFEQFFRISGPNHNTVPGLGLGLYISSQIIKRQKGKIWVESIEGKGSTFCFSLPIKKDKDTNKNHLVEEDIKHD